MRETGDTEGYEGFGDMLKELEERDDPRRMMQCWAAAYTVDARGL